MQHIGPFIVSLNSSNPSTSEFQWCYFVYYDAAGTWSMKTTPIGECNAVPEWNSPALTEHSVPKKVQVVAYAEPMRETLTWANVSMVVKGAGLFRYSATQKAPWFYIANNASGMPTPRDINEHNFQFLTPQAPQQEKLNEAYAIWYAQSKNCLPKHIVDALSKCVGPFQSSVEKILAFTRARNLLSDRASSAYLLTVQLYFSGQQYALERYLNNPVDSLLFLPLDAFQSIMSDLLKQGWSLASIELYAHRLRLSGPENAKILIQNVDVQRSIAALLCASDDVFASELKYIAACDNETRKTILAIPEVNAALRRHITSLDSLNALYWDPNILLKGWNSSSVDTSKNVIIQALGMDVVATWITDLDSFNKARDCITKPMFSQLIWDKHDLLAQSVRDQFDAAGAICLLLTNFTRSDTEILQKITEFVNALPENHHKSCLNYGLVYSAITSMVSIPETLKMALLKIPRIYEAMSHDTFRERMNLNTTSRPERDLLFNVFFPSRIQQFILETGGGILDCLTQEQRVRAHATFSAQELQNRPNLFEIMHREEQHRSAENQRMQPSLFMKIMTHRATPYMGAIFLLAGVALLMMTAQAVLGASLAVVGGLMLFGSYMNKSRRNPHPELERNGSLSMTN